MNNNIAKELNDEIVKDIFGKKEAPKSLVKACQNAKNHMEELSGMLHRLNQNIVRMNVNKGLNELTISTLNDEILKLKKHNKTLQNKLNVSNHKCSAYKSILKDAINEK